MRVGTRTVKVRVGVPEFKYLRALPTYEIGGRSLRWGQSYGNRHSSFRTHAQKFCPSFSLAQVLRRAYERQGCFACDQVESVANISAFVSPVAFLRTIQRCLWSKTEHH